MSLVTRWAGLAGLAALLGGLVLAGIVLPPGDEVIERRLIAWARSCVILLLATSGAELLLRARTMAGGDLTAGLTAVPTVLTRTHFGAVWMARGVALLALLVLVGRRARAAWAAVFGAGLAVAFTTALVGHAADRGDLSVMILIDWLHVVAASVWTGGLFCLAAAVLREARGWPRARVAVAMRRFSTLAGVCLVAVVASGVFNAWMQLGALDALWTSTYGRILFAKVLLVLAVAALGAVWRRSGPSIASGCCPALAAAPHVPPSIASGATSPAKPGSPCWCSAALPS
jgi:putative copper export protein